MPEQSSQRPTLQVAATLVPEAGTPSTASTPFAAAAIADLAQRHSADPAAISVLEVRDVVWPDRGLGCPQPGMAYTQVPVDGLLIRLQLGGQVYEYHSGGGKAPFLCEQPAQPGAGGAGAGGASQ